MRVSEREAFNKIIDDALTTQMRLQNARREMFYFESKFSKKVARDATPSCLVLREELRAANEASVRALGRIRTWLDLQPLFDGDDLHNKVLLEGRT